MIESYDKNKIGKFIAWGGDHVVYDYDTDKVIKFSLIEFIYGKKGQEKSINDYYISKRFFEKYLLETEFVISKDGRYTAAVQPKIFGHYLSKSDLNDIGIQKQFEQIIKKYNKLLKSNYPKIDLVGRGGAFRNFMSNVFVTPGKQLLIIDSTLLEFKSSGMFRPIFFVICSYADWRQKYLINDFLQALNKYPN